MGWNAAHLGDLGGRAAIVTGANSGIGFETARQLAAHGASVILACRDADAGQRAADKIGEGASTAKLDLSSMESIREFADSWDKPLDLLVNNAGVMAPPRRAITSDGYELQFGVNHLGHFVLTGLLLSSLARAEAGRVVTVSSLAHRGGTSDVLDGNTGPYHPQRTYANAKLANLLFADELERQLERNRLPITSTAAHPGLAATGLFTDKQGMGSKAAARIVGPLLLPLFMQSPSAGARSVLYAALVAEPGSYTGPTGLRETRGDVGPAQRSAVARDEKLARRLWHVSEEMTGFRYDWTLHP